MAHPKEIQQYLEKFRADHPNADRSAFLIMSFNQKPIYGKIAEVLKNIFTENQISLLRADDKEYHSDLFLNLQTYMHGCGIGVAVLDRIKSDDVNPNVSFEIGYMMAMYKPMLLLVDESIDGLQADLTGKLYKTFDSYELEKSLKPKVQQWLNDKGLCFSCFECMVTLDKDFDEVVPNRNLLESIIDEIKIHAPNQEPVVSGLQYGGSSRKAGIVFKGEIGFYEKIKRLHIEQRLRLSSQVKVLDVTSITEPVSWSVKDGFLVYNETYFWEMCRLQTWVGTEEIIREAKIVIGDKVVHRLEECSICLLMHNDSLYFIPNLINFGCSYPSKVHLPLWKENNKNVFLLEITKLIAAGPDLFVFPSENEIVAAHHKKIKYFIQRGIVAPGQSFNFHLDGARNVTYF